MLSAIRNFTGVHMPPEFKGLSLPFYTIMSNATGSTEEASAVQDAADSPSRPNSAGTHQLSYDYVAIVNLRYFASLASAAALPLPQQLAHLLGQTHLLLLPLVVPTATYRWSSRTVHINSHQKMPISVN